jgi:hypothetical protein
MGEIPVWGGRHGTANRKDVNGANYNSARLSVGATPGSTAASGETRRGGAEAGGVWGWGEGAVMRLLPFPRLRNRWG